jgi:TRAP-type C4-dicarboxylate transport system permease large subunit
MEGNIYRSAGVAVGICVGLIIAFALIFIANNNRKVKTEYDERQLKVRGDAYRYAFYTVVIYEVILLVVEIGGFTLPLESYVIHFAGILLGILVLSGICIWKDAYWGLNNNRKRYGIILVVAALLNGLPVFFGLKGADGFDFPYVNLLTCIMLLAVGVELLVKHMLDQRAENAED